MAVLNFAVEVIKWFNNHTRALGLLRQEQQKQYGKVLALLHPAATRWTAHYHSANCLLEVEQAVCVCVLSSKAVLIACVGKERAQVDKATQLLAQLERPEFWSHLAEYVSELVYSFRLLTCLLLQSSQTPRTPVNCLKHNPG